MATTDILILSNGPGELTTWVRPVVKALRQQPTNPLTDPQENLRLSLVLSPCPNASGQEAAIARSYPELDRVQAAEQFLPFLLWGKTAEAWDWSRQGLVIFLGGEQLFASLIGKRLGYKILVYAEWETRWHRWVDRFAVMKPQLIEQAPVRYREKLTVVGDLMAEARQGQQHPADVAALGSAPLNSTNLIGLLPGSKAAKLAQGVPLALAVAEQVKRARPQVQFVIPVAPTLSLETLTRFADPLKNPVLNQFGQVTAELIQTPERAYLQTPQGLQIDLHTQSPAYDLLSQCQFCLTTIGANTAELGALAVPMLVLMPTQQLDAMRAWDGLPGLLANLPGIGALFARLINAWFLHNFAQQRRLLAWPNIWAGQEIVPELLGELQPDAVAEQVIDWLDHPEKLAQVRQQLEQIRGEPQAARRVAELAQQLLTGFVNKF